MRGLISDFCVECKETKGRVLMTTKNGQGYYGVFPRSDRTSPFYLSMVVEYQGLQAGIPNIMEPKTWGIFR